MTSNALMKNAGYYYYTNSQSSNTLPILSGTATKITDYNTYTVLSGVSGVDDGWANIPLSADMDFYFFNNNYGKVGGVSQNLGINWNTNNVIMFGTQVNTITWNANTGRGVLIGNYDRRTNTFYYSTVQNSTSPSGYKIIKCYLFYQNVYNDGVPNGAELQFRLIRGTAANSNQAIEVRINKAASTAGTFNITNGTTFQNTFGATVPSTLNTSFVLQGNSTGSTWTFHNGSYVNIV